MNGGTLNTPVDLPNDITLNNTANTIAANGNYRELNGQIGGAGGFTLANGGGTPGLELTNPANAFLGDVVINAGTYLRLTASEVIPDTADVTNNGHLRLDVPGGGTETIAGLTGSGLVWVPTSNNTLQTLVVGAGDATSTYSGGSGNTGQNNADLALTPRSAPARSRSTGWPPTPTAAARTSNSGILSLGTGGTVADTSDRGARQSGTVTVESPAELRLWIKNNAAFVITNDFVLNGGTIHDQDGDYDLQGTVTVNSNSTLSAKYNGKDLTVSGKITGAGTAHRSRTCTATTTVRST